MSITNGVGSGSSAWPVLSSPDRSPTSQFKQAREGENVMRVIPTKYNGYSFRSRTEARWAVFFDEVFINYEYEKEGFIFKDGTAYLPDFYLPDLETWVEIKGDTPTLAEEEKCLKLYEESGKRVVLIYGIPDPNTAKFHTYDRYGLHYYSPVKFLCRYLVDIICEEVRLNFPDSAEDFGFVDSADLTDEITEDLKKGRSAPPPALKKKHRLNKAYCSVKQLITHESEYEGDEYAFGVAKSFRFGAIA